ncbi:trypsin-like peptidase domain-containing protein [Streptomyces sp. NPDC005492]|uniref:trypsin-like serine peptidase n=1 Tax=Streptomyces sp. NPDC005492 TaxID=3156883 RepID=UPI0033B1D8CA
MHDSIPSVTRRLPRRVTVLAVAGTALALVVPVQATAVSGATHAARAADPVATMTFTAAERRQALAYWTPARIKAVGKSVDLGPTGPKSKTWTGPQLKTVGRLFFVNFQGADTWCTATAVTSANRSVVMTAAHCARRFASPDNTSTRMVFVPAYSKGKQPYGAFAVRTALAPRTFAQEGTNDVAALVVDAGRDGRKLTDAVGATPIAFNRPVGGTVSAFGYPATHPQLGEELLRCVGTAKKEIGEQMIPCDMTGGSSGGPWLAGFDARTGKGTLVSVNSGLDSLQPTKMYGEILGATAKTMYQRAERG